MHKDIRFLEKKIVTEIYFWENKAIFRNYNNLISLNLHLHFNEKEVLTFMLTF